MRQILLALMLMVGVHTASAQRPLQVRFNQPAPEPGEFQPYGGVDPQWERRSLPIGNGNIGASLFGSVATERLSLNEITLWNGGPGTSKGPAHYWNVNKKSTDALRQIRKAFAAGDSALAAQLTADNMNGVAAYERGAEPEWRFGNYTTLGELRVATGIDACDEGSYSRTLSLDSALARVSFTAGGVRYVRETFCSHPENVLVVRFTASKKGKQNLLLKYVPSMEAKGTTSNVDANELLYVGNLTNNGMKVVVRIAMRHKGGKVVRDGHEGLQVKGADEVEFILTADTDYKMNFDPDFNDPKTYVGVEPMETTASWLKAAMALNYKRLMRRHLADYRPIFTRVSLSLGADANKALTRTELEKATPDRLADYRRGVADPYLEALYYQFGRYLLISSSRAGNLPANLQGLWLANSDAPWHADYHNNINIQMNYWPVMQGGLQECAKPFVDYVRTLVKPGAVTARDYFGARGWTASISANPFGFTAPLRDRDMSWNLSPVAGPWLAAQVYDIYTFSRDKEWLRNEAYPIIKGAALFCQDFLWRKPDGNYTVAPSTSPEHGIVDDGVTFCQAVVRELLTDAVEAANILGVDQAESAQWQDVLRHLPPYRIGRYGQLMEWSRDIDDPKDEHRHVNHLFGLHPGHTVSWTHTPELAKAARVVLEHRGDGATGWSMGWKLNLWARLLDGNHAYKLYGNLLKNGTADNLWDLHPPFQIDGNFGGTAGVTEMLLQSQDGDIHLLPALPDAWADGEVKGLCARGNFVVDITWRGGQLAEARVRSNSGEAGVVRYKGQTLPVDVKQGETLVVTWEKGKLQAEKAR
ncbi:MAG: glycoside hydrolase family 95 protein [Hallella sp.]|uniref:glycoside hydrolase family 95 protein n=1 Tax=Hallella sp. TaxID=2980186 RepID=UPI002E786D3A|nr:glycoside hydrolase family 95 protein [Hallella sp.]MED9945785.1 glycoside hydrolase family 95 protein [Hallella sp.]